MTRPRLPLALAFALTVAGAPALAIEYRSVAEPAILYDTPSDKGSRLFIIQPGTPVEVVVALDKWIKVRDPGGALTWIERRALAERRTVIITSARATVRQQASDSAPAVFETVKDVVLELSAPPADGWVRVRHGSGASGYLKVTDVWGL